MRKGVVISLVILLVLIVAIAGYFLFFYKINCLDSECFSKALVSCDKANYILDGNETIKLYTIKGKFADSCVVNTKLLQIKKGSAGLESLEGKDMDCYVPLDTLIMPDADIQKCHGLLKEELQEQVMQRMHKQIIENLGQINQSITKII